MLGIVTFVVLLTKHYLLSSILDFGYSASRRKIKQAKRHALGHMLLEVLSTSFLSSHFHLNVMDLLLAMEGEIMLITWWIEYRAKERALLYHLLCELGTVLFYVLVASASLVGR